MIYFIYFSYHCYKKYCMDFNFFILLVYLFIYLLIWYCKCPKKVLLFTCLLSPVCTLLMWINCYSSSLNSLYLSWTFNPKNQNMNMICTFYIFLQIQFAVLRLCVKCDVGRVSAKQQNHIKLRCGFGSGHRRDLCNTMYGTKRCCP